MMPDSDIEFERQTIVPLREGVAVDSDFRQEAHRLLDRVLEDGTYAFVLLYETPKFYKAISMPKMGCVTRGLVQVISDQLFAPPEPDE